MQEDNPLKEEIQTINQTQNKSKKTIIVIGKMNHGKSSFCKMLASLEQKKHIEAKTSNYLVTMKSELFKIDKFKQVINDDMYVLDTPGLDSKDALSVIIEQIDELIIKQKLQIVGIAYILDIHANRDANGDGSSYLFQFLQALRLRYECKQNLTFCILTKYDIHLAREKKNIKLLNQFQEQFYKNGFGDIWERKIKWISDSSESQAEQNFQQKAMLQRDIYSQQISKLGNIISKIYIDKQYQSFEEYCQDKNQYESYLKQQLKKQVLTYIYGNQVPISLCFEVQQKSGGGIILVLSIIIYCILSVVLFIIGAFLAVILVQENSLSEEGGIVVILILLGILIAGGVQVVLKIASKLKKVVKKDDPQRLMQKMQIEQIFSQEIQYIIYAKLKRSLIKYLNDALTIKDDIIQIQKSTLYNTVTGLCQRKNPMFFMNKSRSLQIVEQMGYYQIQMDVGKNIVQFMVNCPTSKQLRVFLEQREFYKYSRP